MGRAFALGLTSVLAVACGQAESEESAARWASVAPDEQVPPAPFDLTTTPGTATAGQLFSFTVTGADPGSTVRVLRGVPGVSCPPAMGGDCLDIGSPTIMWSGGANASGTANGGILLPATAPVGGTMTIQAIGGNGPFLYAEPVAVTIEAPLWADEDLDYGFLPSTVFDLGTGEFKVAYYDGDDLGYGVGTPGSWSLELAHSAGGPGRYNGIALKSDGSPGIAYGHDDAVWYAEWDGVAWATTEVEYQDAERGGDVAFLHTDEPAIAFTDWDAGQTLRYATRSLGVWSIEDVDATGDVEASVRIAVGSDGHPRIAYHETTVGEIRYAWYDGLSWSFESVAPAGHVGWNYGVDLALDDLDQPHIAFVNSSFKLSYAVKGVAGWAVEHNLTNASDAVSIALDDAGSPHIASGDNSGSLHYLWLGDVGWTQELVHSDFGDTGVAIALDATGAAGIAFESSISNGDLRWATRASAP